MADEKTLAELYSELSEKVGNSEQYKEFLSAVKALDDAMKPLHQVNRMGFAPLVTGEVADNLLELHLKIGEKADEALKSEEDKDLREMVRKISGLVSINYNMLKSYDASKPVPLRTILEDARTLTLDIKDVKAPTVGGALSKRQAVSFMDDRGRTIHGFFTPKSDLNVWNALKKDLNALADKMPPQKAEAAEMIRTLLDSFEKESMRQYNIEKEHESIAAGDHTDTLIHLFSTIQDGKEVGYEKLKGVFNLLNADKLNDREVEEVMSEMDMIETMYILQKYLPHVSMNYRGAGIRDGNRIDTRNCAFSTVADLLGVPELAARAVPMKLKGPNGQITEGIFMQEAAGYDYQRLPTEAQFVNEQSYSPKSFKSIADLQVLDYLCGNIDRHGSNLAYQVNKDNILTGVQAFDNDCTFGLRIPKGKEGYNRLVGLEDMCAVSESMYKHLMLTTPAQLRLSLRGYGLSEKELDAACERMNMIKNELEAGRKFYEEYDKREPKPDKLLVPGHIRVLKDSEWAQLKPADLCRNAGNKSKNLFDIVRSNLRNFYNSVMNAIRKNKQKKLRASEVLRSQNRAVPDAPEKEKNKADLLLNELTRVTKGDRTSDEFENIRDAVTEYREFQEKLKLRLELAGASKDTDNIQNAIDKYITTEDVQKMEKLSKNIRDLAKKYIDGKPDDVSPQSYTGKRIEAAKYALRFGESGMKRTPEEYETLAMNDRRGMEEMNRRMARAMGLENAVQPKPAVKEEPAVSLPNP